MQSPNQFDAHSLPTHMTSLRIPLGKCKDEYICATKCMCDTTKRQPKDDHIDKAKASMEESHIQCNSRKSARALAGYTVKVNVLL